MRAYYENRYKKGKNLIQIGISENMNFLPHWQNDLEIICVLDGQINIRVNHETKLLKQDDIAICNKGDIHSFDSGGHESKIIIVIFPIETIERDTIEVNNKRYIKPYIERKYIVKNEDIDAIKKIKYNLMAILKEVKDSIAYEYIVRAKLYEIWGLLLNNFSEERLRAEQNTKTNINEISYIHKILGDIDENYKEVITLSGTAKKFNLSVSYLSRLFKKITGIGFLNYITSKRILESELLLKKKELTISQIAFECGFQSVRTFNRVFKTINGITPSEF